MIFFLVRKYVRYRYGVKKKNLIVQSLFFIGAGEKNTRSRSKTDQLRNTARNTDYNFGINSFNIPVGTTVLVLYKYTIWLRAALRAAGPVRLLAGLFF